MATKRKKGLCFNCDEKFVPGHKCKPPVFLCLMAESDENDIETVVEEETTCIDTTNNQLSHAQLTPQISFHAYTGQFVPSTLKLARTIHGKTVVVLIDSGFTNNFMQTRLASHLGLTVQPSPHLTVTVGNGEALGYARVCSQTPLKIEKA